MQCSTPGCRDTAVVQWARHGDDQSARVFAEQIRGQQQAMTDYQRQQAAIDLVEHQRRLATLEQGIADGTLEAVQSDVLAGSVHLLRAQTEAKQAEFDAIADPPVVADDDLEPVIVAVAACQAHHPGDERTAATHPPECCSDGPCACDVELPEPVEL